MWWVHSATPVREKRSGVALVIPHGLSRFLCTYTIELGACAVDPKEGGGSKSMLYAHDNGCFAKQD